MYKINTYYNTMFSRDLAKYNKSILCVHYIVKENQKIMEVSFVKGSDNGYGILDDYIGDTQKYKYDFENIVEYFEEDDKNYIEEDLIGNKFVLLRKDDALSKYDQYNLVYNLTEDLF